MAAVSNTFKYELTQLQPAGVDQTNRRKWDRAVFEQKAKERLERENGTFEDDDLKRSTNSLILSKLTDVYRGSNAERHETD